LILGRFLSQVQLESPASLLLGQAVDHQHRARGVEDAAPLAAVQLVNLNGAGQVGE
jgi:hypothetical protein